MKMEEGNLKVILVGGGCILISAVTIGGLIWFFRKCSRRSTKSKKRSATLFPGQHSKTLRLPGLTNIGNSCYLNSILQSMSSLRLPVMGGNGFVEELSYILTKLNDTNKGSNIDASKLVKSMGGRLSGEQQDAHELLIAMLSVLGKSMNRQSEESINIHLIGLQAALNPKSTPALKQSLLPWEGWQAQAIRCNKCECTSTTGTRLNTFTLLSIPPADSLQDAFYSTHLPNPVQDYKCAHCSWVGTSYQHNLIVRWPSILIFHVQRTMWGQKDSTWMQFPLLMDAFPQNKDLLSADITRPAYRLTAVVQHSGMLGSGHYTAFKMVDVDGEQRWVYCSDTIVREVTVDQVLSAEAYLLFYQSV